ncbi:MAG: hypothetical protein WC655_04625, partial [Candidatus Hydrogenedentales bacterium]
MRLERKEQPGGSRSCLESAGPLYGTAVSLSEPTELALVLPVQVLVPVPPVQAQVPPLPVQVLGPTPPVQAQVPPLPVQAQVPVLPEQAQAPVLQVQALVPVLQVQV